MRAYIVTGTTRGIGRAIASTVIGRKYQLLSLSRAPNKLDPFWHNLTCDLSRPESVRSQLAQLIETISLDRFSDLVLINNAGTLDPMGPLDSVNDDQLLDHLNVNLASPAILTSAFIQLTEGFNAVRRIINISSGAAKHPYAGWAVYCATKAALDMVTMCTAAEQRGRHDPVSVCAVYPGRVDTDMQVKIRQSDPGQFPAQPEFVSAKKQNRLTSPTDTARLIITLDADGQFNNGCIYDLRSAAMDGQKFSIQPVRSLLKDDGNN